jgi:hypothetical protein
MTELTTQRRTYVWTRGWSELRDRLSAQRRKATESSEYLRKKTARLFVFLREGAALEGGPERVSDPDAQERYQEVTTCKGMRKAINRCVFRASS